MSTVTVKLSSRQPFCFHDMFMSQHTYYATITSLLRQNDVIMTSKWRRFYVITTLFFNHLLGCVGVWVWVCVVCGCVWVWVCGCVGCGVWVVVIQVGVRLLHSLSLVAIGLFLKYVANLLISSAAGHVIHWYNYKLGNSSHAMHYGFTGPVGIPTVSERPLAVPFHNRNERPLIKLTVPFHSH